MPHTRAATRPADPPRVPPRGRRSPWVRRFLLFVICVAAMNALIGDRGLMASLRAGQEQERAVAELLAMRRANTELREEVRRLQGDPATLELVARRELGLIRSGEILFVVRPALPAARGPSPRQPDR